MSFGKRSKVTDELAEFLELEPQVSVEGDADQPPPALMDCVRRDLQPSALRIGLRLGAVHAVAGALTLAICPQFGIGPIGGGHGLMGVFMQFGEFACAAGCGSFFMGASVLTSLMILTPDELRVIRQQGAGLGYWLALAGLSMGLFMVFGNAMAESVSYLSVWLGSGILAAVLIHILRGSQLRAVS